MALLDQSTAAELGTFVRREVTILHTNLDPPATDGGHSNPAIHSTPRVPLLTGWLHISRHVQLNGNTLRIPPPSFFDFALLHSHTDARAISLLHTARRTETIKSHQPRTLSFLSYPVISSSLELSTHRSQSRRRSCEL